MFTFTRIHIIERVCVESALEVPEYKVVNFGVMPFLLPEVRSMCYSPHVESINLITCQDTFLISTILFIKFEDFKRYIFRKLRFCM